MLFLGKFINNFRDFYNDINSATLTGAIDVIIVKQPDGSYVCSPFHVRFGKIGVLRSREKVVDIEVNGEPADIHMKLGESGEAFFVEEVYNGNRIPAYLATSPLPDVPDIQKELDKMKFETGLSIALNHDDPDPNTESDITPIPPEDIPVLNSILNANPDCDNTIHATSNPTIIPQPAHSKETSPVEDVTNSVNTDSSDEYRTKRKRRKKVGAKKRNKAKEAAAIKAALTATSSEEKPEDIFQMDDDFEQDAEEKTTNGLSRSVSLPVTANIDTLLGKEWVHRKLSTTYMGEFHPFSDGDVTPQSSPVASRPPSPKSDTEYETQKIESGTSPDVNSPSWVWGQLPNVPRHLNDPQWNSDPSRTQVNVKDVENAAAEAEKRSMLGEMLSFMRSTRKMRIMPEGEGIYLSELNSDELDPELAALYFPKFKSPYQTTELKDEDTESGKGPSLPHSPHTVEGMGGTLSQDSDSDERLSIENFSKEKSECNSFPFYSDIAMSLCGGLQDPEVDIPDERFQHSLVTFDEFTENPAVLQDPNLVIRIGGKYYNWLTAASMLTSIIMFQRPLPEKTAEQLINEHMPKKKKKSYSWWSWRRTEETARKNESDANSTAHLIMADPSVMPTNSLPEIAVDPMNLSQTKPPESPEQKPCDTVTESTNVVEMTLKDTVSAVAQEVSELEIDKQQELNEKSPTSETPASEVVDMIEPSDSSEYSSTLTSPIEVLRESFRPDNDVQHLSAPETFAQQVSLSAKEGNDMEATNDTPVKEQYMKSLRLTSDQITKLNLMDGPNEFAFSVTTAYQGTTKCTCQVFLWNYNDKIVISDIDGTITKSDVLGHILPIVGHSWAQMGVAQLFTRVQSNGYKFLYLSARAIGQARTTREYLRKVRQAEICLPDGPLLLSPTSLISALHREVIERKPEEFKISCLKDIQTLFPQSMGNPFYAGFGNKINDTWAYKAVGIPYTRSFTINHKGELKLEFIQTFQSSYSRLSDDVDHVFPPLLQNLKGNGQATPIFSSPEEFSYFTYWREPLPAISDKDFAL